MSEHGNIPCAIFCHLLKRHSPRRLSEIYALQPQSQRCFRPDTGIVTSLLKEMLSDDLSTAHVKLSTEIGIGIGVFLYAHWTTASFCVNLKFQARIGLTQG